MVFFAGITGNYVRQELSFHNVLRNIKIETSHDKSNFFLADIEVGYRFPKQYGKLTFKVDNIFDKKFRYQDFFYEQAQETSRYQPGRTILMRLNINY